MPFSDPLQVECCAPHGSILGLLLFSIYVNDRLEAPCHCCTECYVDDAKLFLFFNLLDSQRIVQEINEHLLRMRNWCFEESRQDKITVFGSRQMTSKLHEFHLSLLGKDISPVKSAKDLDVILDPNLAFVTI